MTDNSTENLFTAGRFPAIRFRGRLRPSQQEVIEIARQQLAEGNRRLHIVAPPGSGKTVLGLYLWAECIARPAAVFSPNSAIQGQWAERVDLFETPSPRDELVSTDPEMPGLLTSLTYQSITMPNRGSGSLDAVATSLWIDHLLEQQHAETPAAARQWIDDLQERNPAYYARRLSSWRSRLRDEQGREGNALDMLHHRARQTIDRLKAAGVGLIILDECHHLLGHWGRVLAEAHDLLDGPVIVGLTATPPDRRGHHNDDVTRYDEFFGPVDFEVPVPAVVKDGFLAPYQDLAWFVRPEADELAWIAGTDRQLHAVVESLCAAADTLQPEADHAEQAGTETDSATSGAADRAGDKDQAAAAAVGDVAQEPDSRNWEPAAEADEPDSADDVALPDDVACDTGAEQEEAGQTGNDSASERVLPLPEWVADALASRRAGGRVQKNWAAFERRDAAFALAARLFLLRRERDLPDDVPEPVLDLPLEDVPELEYLVPVLDRYIRHGLRLSRSQADHRLAERAIGQLRVLGWQVTETGCQPCASPVGRVMACSRAKAGALVPILEAEIAALGDSLRAIVVTDFEKTSAVSSEVSHLLDDESGGAMAAFRVLISHDSTDTLDPVLLTGSSVLVDDDLAERFCHEAEAWLAREGVDCSLSLDAAEGFHAVNGQGPDWCPRVYVAMVTELFQQGVTRCLVGTRGLLGEGWDANRINVLVDLTAVTASMSVNQLRGRSIRLDPSQPNKVANNWDVVCIAPEFARGLDDYHRFLRRHETLFGVTDDGAIEKGVGHVHAAFQELHPEGLESSTAVLNEEMLRRAARRDQARELWKIGEPYYPEPVRTVETRPVASHESGQFPQLTGAREPWTAGSLGLAVGHAVLGALLEAGLLSSNWDVHASERAGGYVRLFLERAGQADSVLFARSVHEVFAPFSRARYVIPRQAVARRETWISRLLPSLLGRYFRRSEQELAMLHAVPTALAKNRQLVRIFERYWNAHVSPGKAVYALQGAGEQLVNEARRNRRVPQAAVQEKEVFLQVPGGEAAAAETTAAG